MKATKFRLVAVLTCGLVECAILISSSAAAPLYHLIDLGADLTGPSSAWGINDVGQVTGKFQTTSGDTHGFRTAPSSPINSTTDDLATLGGDLSQGYALNDTGSVVGYSSLGSGTVQGFRTATNSVINPGTDNLGTLGGPNTYAWGINNDGQVTGQSTIASSSSTFHAFRTAPNNAIDSADDLGTLGGPNSYGLSINASGQVTGYADLALGEWHAFRTTPTGSIDPSTDLGTLGGINSYGYAINDNGQVAGSSITPTNQEHAFVTSSNAPINTGADDLGTLGGTFSRALGINNSGWVVGASDLTLSGPQHGFLYADGNMYDLNLLLDDSSPSILIGTATAINNSGLIVGYGEGRALLLVPVAVPEPSGFALTAIAAIMFILKVSQTTFRKSRLS